MDAKRDLTAGPKQARRPNAGSFKKGQSGNPGGRLKKPPELIEIETLAREVSPLAIQRLTHWLKSDDPRASVAAANAILDRAYGKARQPSDATVTIKRDVREMTEDELNEIIAAQSARTIN